MLFLSLVSSTIGVGLVLFLGLFWGILGYNSKKEAAVKALVLAMATFVIYALPLFLIGNNGIIVPLVVAFLVFFLVYTQATSPWQWKK